MDGHIAPSARRLNPIPSIDSLSAEAIAMADPEHNGASVTMGAPTRLSIAEFDNTAHLVWRVNVLNGGYGGFANYWIDAHNGAILRAKTAIRG